MDPEVGKLTELVLSAGARKALDLGFDKLKSVLTRVKTELSTPQYEIDKAVSDHEAEVRTWAAEISFTETPVGRRLSDIFVPLNIYTSRRRSLYDQETLPDVDLEETLAADKRSCIILGQPGAGKTTALKHLCQRFFDDEAFLPNHQILIRIHLRDLNISQSTTVPEYIRRFLQETLRLRISYPKDLEGEGNSGARRAIRDSVITDWLNAVHALLILDGFDEITLKIRRDLVVEELRRFSAQLTDASFILTTRSGEFSAHIERTNYIEIKPFSQEQIAKFAVCWLGGVDAKKFLSQLQQSPYHDTAIRPLTLAHLCVIFERSKRIPSKPKTVYRKIVRLLLEDWDQEKSVVRESAYADFEADRKEEFLANLAYELTCMFKTTSFSTVTFLKCYEMIHGNFGLPLAQATKVVDEIETHTGLFVQGGQDRFEFSHKSLQEFLTAEFIVRMPSIPKNMIELQIMPDELAIATAISSQPSEYLTQLVINHFNQIKTSFQFTRSFVNRLLVEDPDFEETPRVGFALLALYSQYLRALVHHNQQLSLFVLDQLGKEFSILRDKIRQRVTMDELDDLFDRSESTHTFEGELVWLLTRKREKQGKLRRADLSVLPDELYVRESLLADPADGAPERGAVPIQAAVAPSVHRSEAERPAKAPRTSTNRKSTPKAPTGPDALKKVNAGMRKGRG
jgi:hypothetical protein